MLLRSGRYKLMLVIALLIGACSDVPEFELVEQKPKVVVLFNLVNNGQSLRTGQEFTDAQGYRARLNKLRFYVSDMKLVDASGASQSLSDVELVDFEQSKESQAVQFARAYSYIVAKGHYTGLVFSIGLDENLNASDPTTFPNDHPLSVYANTYWSWADMYKFIEMGAAVDTNGDASLDTDIEFHTGTNVLYRPGISCPVMLNLDAFEKDTLWVNIDWNKLFHPGGPNDIVFADAPFTHTVDGPESLELATRFTDNFSAALAADTLP